ncbi:DUF305 domain-containing protein [Paenibacillus sp. FSL H8-0548]|uniref:DUF305 domain-containing protein n=1 Tax=Paenibacillus sp. FSL H8-0548 TaxID=1920422 RepID=UPI00096C8120|nr:DUF305 domain-containing protein [Paenibacillus sp. FSL H8-0548]OMF33755.1 DUF305 domain-containing protein [Paenibacillus sp. FSL H8-0548]
MGSHNELSLVTKAYLDSFFNILNNMIREMTSVQLTNSISDIFIRQMIPHHAAAIEMSKNILRYTTNLELQSIALHIIAEQTKSIMNMRDIQQKCSLITNTDYERSQYMNRFGEISKTMFYEMGSAPITNGINANFVREMIPHHEGAVRMSHNALQFNICPMLKPILNAIITSQCEGIKQMKQLLARLDCC